MKIKLRNENCISTGANKGIGFEIVKELAEKDFLVFLSARNSEKGNKAVEVLKKKGLNVEFLEIDVSDKQSIEHASGEFKSKLKDLDLLVNNAAILIDQNDITKLDLDNISENLNYQYDWTFFSHTGISSLYEKRFEDY